MGVSVGALKVNANERTKIETSTAPSGAYGENSRASGEHCLSQGKNSTASGKKTIAKGQSSTTIGDATIAAGDNSFASGSAAIIKGERKLALKPLQDFCSGTVAENTSGWSLRDSLFDSYSDYTSVLIGDRIFYTYSRVTDSFGISNHLDDVSQVTASLFEMPDDFHGKNKQSKYVLIRESASSIIIIVTVEHHSFIWRFNGTDFTFLSEADGEIVHQNILVHGGNIYFTIRRAFIIRKMSLTTGQYTDVYTRTPVGSTSGSYPPEMGVTIAPDILNGKYMVMSFGYTNDTSLTVLDIDNNFAVVRTIYNVAPSSYALYFNKTESISYNYSEDYCRFGRSAFVSNGGGHNDQEIGFMKPDFTVIMHRNASELHNFVGLDDDTLDMYPDKPFSLDNSWAINWSGFLVNQTMFYWYRYTVNSYRWDTTGETNLPSIALGKNSKVSGVGTVAYGENSSASGQTNNTNVTYYFNTNDIPQSTKSSRPNPGGK